MIDMSKPAKFLRKMAETMAKFQEESPEEFDLMIRGSQARRARKREYEGLSPDEAFDLSIAEMTAHMAFDPLQEDLGRDGVGERFDLLTHYIRQREIVPEAAEIGAEQLGMTVPEFLERVRYMNERLEFHFRNAVAEMNDPEYVEEETKYLLSLMDRAVKPRDPH